MSDFIVYPAVDLRFGKVVRLRQGRGDQQTVYSNDPAAVALDWINQGAPWLHVVNLNGAFGESTRENEAAIQQIVSAGKGRVKVQLGGGIRTAAQIETALATGVSRVILGTVIIEEPDFGVNMLRRFGGDRIVLGFDAVKQELMTHGWQAPTGVLMTDVANRFADAGAETLIYTNIQKDGMQTGVDWENAQQLAVQTGLAVIASGGTASLEDITRVKDAGLHGVIVGRALYEGSFTLKEAFDAG
jgi:phosphoribosylformimino-5-aminoimidazole carboxamide ribotide isomerase